MNVEFNFKDISIEVAPLLGELENVITKVHYSYTGVDSVSGKSSFRYGQELFEPVEGGSFTPFADVTETQVISWLADVVDTQIIEPYLIKEIENQIIPKYVSVTAPWESQTT